MIVLFRVDHRLLHGQVAFSWVKTLDADCILVANDEVCNDDIRKTTLKLAKPQGSKLVIKNIEDSIQAINSGNTDKYRLLIVVESIKDAYKIIDKCDIKSLNLGGTKATSETKNISKAINITNEDEKLLNKILEKNVEIEIRQLPNDIKKIYK